MLSANSFVLNF